MKVCKFGGSSLATAAQLKKVAAIIQADPTRKIIVVSAPGKRSEGDAKVTDLLIQLAEAALYGEEITEPLHAVRERFTSIANELDLGREIERTIEADLIERLAFNQSNPELFMDQLKAAGEDNSAKLLACYLKTVGVAAEYRNPKEMGLLVAGFPNRAQALPQSYERLAALSDTKAIAVFPGFFGFTETGILRTFERGGSDITGAILAAAVKAELYENFTDVDCVFATNPKLVENPVEIKQLTYREMRELAYAGFSVFHDEALMPAFKESIPVCIKNTNNPNAAGTMIVSHRSFSELPVTGISADNGFSTLYVSKYLMNREIGFGRKLLQILEDEGISYEHIPSGIDNLSIILRSRQLDFEKETRIIERVKTELQADDVHFRSGFSMVVLVGEGMHHTVGLAARAASAIARTGASIEMINQGSSKVSLVFGVLEQDEVKIVRELYKEFFSSVLIY